MQQYFVVVSWCLCRWLLCYCFMFVQACLCVCAPIFGAFVWGVDPAVFRMPGREVCAARWSSRLCQAASGRRFFSFIAGTVARGSCIRTKCTQWHMFAPSCAMHWLDCPHECSQIGCLFRLGLVFSGLVFMVLPCGLVDLTQTFQHFTLSYHVDLRQNPARDYTSTMASNSELEVWNSSARCL